MTLMNSNRILYIFCLCALALLDIGCSRPVYRNAQGMVWNTTYNITYEADTDLSDSVIAELKRVERSVSAFDPSSVVSLINRNESDVTDSLFRQVYNTAVEVNRLSGGAFDPTLAPLINAWGFGYEKTETPDSAHIREILQYIGIEKTSLEHGRLNKQDPRIQFNFSAIAKGFGCDCVGAMFERLGVDNYMVEIGGEIRMGGKNPKGAKWNISIDKPIFSADSEIHESQTVLPLTDCGMATSGNYRNFKEIDGKRVVHTIDRFTGCPALNDLLSVTVIVPASKTVTAPCMLADALATACMSMGSEKAKAMIESQGFAALFILADGTIWQSPRLLSLTR